MKAKRIERAIPKVGDYVRLRGRTPCGVIKAVGPNAWVRVDWTEAAIGPKIVHRDELEVL